MLGFAMVNVSLYYTLKDIHLILQNKINLVNIMHINFMNVKSKQILQTTHIIQLIIFKQSHDFHTSVYHTTVIS